MVHVNSEQSKNCVSSRGMSVFAVEVPARTKMVSLSKHTHTYTPLQNTAHNLLCLLTHCFCNVQRRKSHSHLEKWIQTFCLVPVETAVEGFDLNTGENNDMVIRDGETQSNDANRGSLVTSRAGLRRKCLWFRLEQWCNLSPSAFKISTSLHTGCINHK